MSRVRPFSSPSSCTSSETLQSMWILRNHVVSSTSLHDMAALAIACPALRCKLVAAITRCYKSQDFCVVARAVYFITVAERDAESAANTHDAKVEIAMNAMANIAIFTRIDMEKVPPRGSTSTRVMLPWMIVELAGPELAGMMRRLHKPPKPFETSASARAFECACCTGMLEAVTRMNFAHSLDKTVIAACLARVCERGDADIVELLTRPPYCATKPFSENIEMCLNRAVSAAIKSGHDELLRIIGASIYGSLWPKSCSKFVLDALCLPDAKLARVLRTLAGEPFCVSRENCIAAFSSALMYACDQGDLETLAVLSERPFSMNHSDAVTLSALAHACCNPDTRAAASTIYALARPPYSLSSLGSDPRWIITAALEQACNNDDCTAVVALTAEPYFVGRQDAIKHGALAIITRVDVPSNAPRTDSCKYAAWMSKRMAIFSFLAAPPFLLDGSDARRDGALTNACVYRNAPAIAALAQAPYNLGHEDALIVRNNARSTRLESTPNRTPVWWYTVAPMLSEPPYMLSEEEIDAVDT